MTHVGVTRTLYGINNGYLLEAPSGQGPTTRNSCRFKRTEPLLIYLESFEKRASVIQMRVIYTILIKTYSLSLEMVPVVALIVTLNFLP